MTIQSISTSIRNILTVTIAAACATGCTVVSHSDTPSTESTATNAILQALFEDPEFKDITRKCRFKHGGYDLTITLDPKQEPPKIHEYRCVPSLTERFTSLRNPADPFRKFDSRVKPIALQLIDIHTGDLLFASGMREKTPPHPNPPAQYDQLD